MKFTRPAPGSRADFLLGVVLSVAAVAVVTGAIQLFKPYVPVLSLGVLYVFAVLPIAVAYGLGFALAVSVASMLAFNWFYLPPVHTFTLADSSNWFALAVYLGTAVVVSELAARDRRRAAAAEQRGRESALLAELATELLRGRALDEELDEIASRAAQVLGVEGAEIELGQPRRHATGTPHPLEVAGPLDRHDLHAGRRRPEGRRSATLPAGARGAARGRSRSGPSRARGARGRDASPQRSREDGAASRRVA